MANGHEKMLTTAIREMQTKLPWDTVKKSTNLDFHGDTVAKNSPSNAEYMALDPHALEQLRPCATTTQAEFCN